MARQGGKFMAVALVALAAPATAAANPGPRIVSARFADRPHAGAPAQLLVKVRDPLAAINGYEVDFGDGASVKQSACRPRVGGHRFVESPFRIGSLQAFGISHHYLLPGEYTLRLRAMSGDCVRGVEVSRKTLKVRVRPPLVGDLAPTEVRPARARAPKAVAAQAPCPNMFLLPTPDNTAALRRAELCLVNAVRRSRGVAALRTHRRLRRASRRHAVDMVARDYFAHETPEGVDLTTRLRRVRFRRYGTVSENLAAGTELYATPLGIVLAWLGSPPHRANLLDRSFRRVGLGVAFGMPDERAYYAGTYAMVLATPP